jgi:hypothetical protein
MNRWASILEPILLLLAAVGVGLVVGAFLPVAGIGAGLLTAAIGGLVLIVAYERGTS